MRPPCEIIVAKALPAIRTVLVRDLVDRHDLSQKQAAERLGVTQAAVSQYLSSIRGDEKLEKKLEKLEIFSEIQSLSDKVATEGSDKSQIISDICDICDLIRKEGTLCKIHFDEVPSLSEEKCEVCL
ncbi:hypothetical protein AKJ65_06190 [candidate division MSBL1 archaeon SCGC-AAA259E19]|uniref:HTH cro/C1-type domain-containing protein n=2 Tax=candidate division MSBL1 TaxID=215777 RepID=A0A133V5M3_9EURY|nr:hypothetical protein AKJ65_06190 [candidate division MSBL1 archaeon SCGC-AAA259E19]KXB01742.1 hypothetical protein AKJ41_00505 [candidate division MSBL1 archaeon SCGC-AAA259O05]